MGKATRFDIADLTKRYGLQYFVETGTGQAESLTEVVERHPFRGYYSCDWDEIMIMGSRYRLRDHPDVHIAHARSTDFLETLLLWLPRSSPVLFWLDAHFPGNSVRDDGLRLPLASELGIIARLRPEGRDVIMVDDLAIYLDGSFDVPLPDELRQWCPKERDIGFVFETLGNTHNVAWYYDGGGYIIATPNEKYPA